MEELREPRLVQFMKALDQLNEFYADVNVHERFEAMKNMAYELIR